MLRRRNIWLVSAVFLLQFILVVMPAFAFPLTQSGWGVTHVVKAGDTLWNIAQRYGVSLAAIKQANGITDPDTIRVGQSLLIPGVAASVVDSGFTSSKQQPGKGLVSSSGMYVVKRGETLSAIAARYGITVSELAMLNGIADANALYAGQRLIIPGTVQPVAGFDVRFMPSIFVSIVLREDRPKQGDTVLVSVDTTREATVMGSFEGQVVRFANYGMHHWGLVPIHPMANVGPHELKIRAMTAEGEESEAIGTIWVEAGKFEVENVDLPPDRQKLLDPKLIAAERRRLSMALGDTDPLPLWQGRFICPLSSPLISSEFGTRRSYNGGPANSYHEGFDFDAPEGVPVRAAADGRVVMAEKLTVRGNALLIDHGLGVHSGYWHLSEIDVKVGDLVRAGQVVGKVGGTGLATGPHLHWEVRIGEINVNPKQWMEETFP